MIPVLGLRGDAADATVSWVVVICSAVAIAYTALGGGLRAVVITDVVQFILLPGDVHRLRVTARAAKPHAGAGRSAQTIGAAGNPRFATSS